MAEQNSGIFRQKALERITAPEQLTDYLRVTSPGIWTLFAAIIILLGGLLVWSTVGTLETFADGYRHCSFGAEYHRITLHFRKAYQHYKS